MIFMSCFCGAGVKSYNFGPGIRLKFRINILLQHRELHTADFQHLAVKFFSGQNPGPDGSARRCAGPEGLSSPSSISDNSRGFQDVLIDFGDNGAFFDAKGFQEAGCFGLGPAVVVDLNIQK